MEDELPTYDAVARYGAPVPAVEVTEEKEEQKKNESLANLRERLMNAEQKINDIRREEWQNEIPTIENITNDIQLLKTKSNTELQQVRQIWKSENSGCAMACHCCVCCPWGCDAANIYYKESISPKVRELREIRKTESASTELLKISKSWNYESKTEWKGGIAVAYNQATGKTEWKKGCKEGICGVYNPMTQEIEWKTYWNGDVYGVYHPLKQEIEWKEKWHHGIGGVWNPDKQEIEWKEAWNQGICGVWNPDKHIVEWKETWGGVAGYFDENEGVVKWVEEPWGGIAIIRWNSVTQTFDTSRGVCWDWSK